jgi:uncharacterized protein (TIGR00255 family)
MTGYASAQTELAAPQPHAPALRIGLEIRSVNSRFLDLSFKMPEELRQHETTLRELMTRQLKRGKVELRVNIDSQQDNSLVRPNTELLTQLASLQDHIHSVLPRANPLSVADILRLSAQSNPSQQDLSGVLLKLAQNALHNLTLAREREGQRLAQSLLERIAQLRTLAAQAKPLIPQLVEQQRQRFLERWKDAMNLAEGSVPTEAAQDRALSEATAFAIRIDVAEELTRLASHLDEINALLENGGKSEGIGKRLDFLIQELHREANTLGSKSATLETTRISVDMKVLIEQMREQVQNLE